MVEGRDCDDWMAVDLGMVWYAQHNWISLILRLPPRPGFCQLHAGP